jgi:hypothetical protein
MRITITSPVKETGSYGTVPPGEYEAEPTSPGHPIDDFNRRPCEGYFIRQNGRTYRVPAYDYNLAVKAGKIKEEDMSNLPAISTENAVVTITPQEQINQASDMARLLKEVVSKAGLARKLGGRKEHLEYEAWATIARWFHCTPSTEWTKPIKDGEKIVGWEARVNILDDTGRVIGSSEGMCMSDEANWRGKPSYALRSMAQTRTAGKALRSLFAHIAVLAGYSPTPADEMDGIQVNERTDPKPAPPSEPAHTDEATLPQKKKLYAMATQAFGDKEHAMEFISWALEQTGEPKWTKKLISGLFDDFDAQSKLFVESKQTKAA